MLNLDNALSSAYEEIEDLRRRVLELETQAAELLKSDDSKGEPFRIDGSLRNQLSPMNKSQAWVFQSL